jgi:hypothetical protein
MAKAQSTIPAQTGSVPDRIALGSSSGSKANTPQDPQQDVSQAGAKPGIVTGTVLDRGGSVVAGAAVHLTSESNSFSQQTISGYNGEFSFANVPPGPFKLAVTAEGFDKQEFSGEIATGQTLIMPPIVISIATVVSQVKVTGNPVEVATAQVREQEQQRVLRFIPNFYVTYRQDAAPLTTRLKFQLAWKSSADPVTIFGTAFLAGTAAGG